MKPLNRISAFVAAGLILALPWPALAARDTGVCDNAAQRASSATGVPEHILRAIARVEAGRQQEGIFAPWPWTVNQGGRGSFFDSLDAALMHVRTALNAGETNIDIGCFQVNIRWHGTAFPSLEAMFDPDRNALYAAQFLQRLSEETGSWEGAIGAYHSRRAEAASSYLTKVAAHIGAMPLAVHSSLAEADVPLRANTYPLLQGGQGRLGSLVTIEARSAPSSLLR